MKQFLIAIATLCLSFFTGTLPSLAQVCKRPVFPEALITPYELATGYHKTSILIFPAPISPSGVDRGSADIIAKPVPGVDNILKLKANKEGFEPTNLTVITTDGRVYAFRIFFSDNPPDEPIDFRKQLDTEDAVARFRNRSLNDEQLQQVSERIAADQPFMHKRKAGSGNMKMKLEGIYSSGNVLFYRFALKNRSRIDYDVDFSRFYIRGRKQARRTAEQEKEIKPLRSWFEHGPTIAGRTKQTLVIAFDKFTIADKKDFVMQLFEKNGDRHLTLKANGNDITGARQLPIP